MRLVPELGQELVVELVRHPGLALGQELVVEMAASAPAVFELVLVQE